MTDVSVRELKSRLSEHLRRLEKGESFTVTKRGKPIGRLSPVTEGKSAQPETDAERLKRKLQALVEKGVLLQVGEKPKGLRNPVKLTGEGPTVSEMVLADRR